MAERAFDAVIFDFSGVVVSSAFSAITAVLGDQLDHDAAMELLMGPYDRDTDHPWHQVERGEMTMVDWVAHVDAEAAERGLTVDWKAMGRTFKELEVHDVMVDRIRSLRAEGYRTALLTNNIAEGSDTWRKMIPVDELFEVVVDSSAVGMRKPDPRIYKLTLERLGGIEPRRRRGVPRRPSRQRGPGPARGRPPWPSWWTDPAGSGRRARRPPRRPLTTRLAWTAVSLDRSGSRSRGTLGRSLAQPAPRGRRWGVVSMADPRAPRAPFAPWDRRELPGAFTVEESARRVGNYKWIEMRLFEALGGWVATVPELDVKMRLGTHCYHHAWHAELWHKRLPELREMNPDRLTVPPNDELVAFVAALTEPEAPELTIEKLVGVYRVLIPHKIAAYTYHLNNTSTITDAPTIRSLNFALQDEFDDWRDGEMLIQSLLLDARRCHPGHLSAGPSWRS